jgi:hypothetical protein
MYVPESETAQYRTRGKPSPARSAVVVMTRRLATALVTVLLASVLAQSVIAAAAPASAGMTTVSIDTDDGNVTVANASSQVISGTADVPEGTEIHVRVRSTGDTQPMLFMSRTAVVTENGTWAAVFDFNGTEHADTFSVKATIEDTNHSTTASGYVVGCVSDCEDEPPADTPTAIPEQTPTPTQTAAERGVSLDAKVVSVMNEEVAAIELTFEGIDKALITIGDENETNYELTALVRDADGDGTAVLYVDTVLAGREGTTVSASGGDEVELRSETSLESSLDPGNYDLQVYAGNETEGGPTTVGTLIVEDIEGTPPTDTSTATDEPAQDESRLDGFGGAAVSVLFLAGGGIVALLLVRG